MTDIAILGFGVVGGGVADLLMKNAKQTEALGGDGINVKYILDLRDFPGSPFGDRVVHDFGVILADESVSCIVETMGGYPNLPIGCSEYGCEALDWHTSEPKQGDYTEEYQAYYHEELIKQLFTRKYLWVTHVWNMFDFGADGRNEGGENGQNHKGLMTFDRKYKKDSFYAYKAWLVNAKEDPFVHICGKRYVDRVEDVTKVTVYSNLPSVELFANGESLGVQESPEHFFYFNVPNKGKTTLVAKAGSCSDESTINKVEKFNEKYRLKEEGALLNWFDITAPEGYFSLNDKIGDIIANPEGEKLFGELMKQFMGGSGKKKVMGFELSPAMMKMIGGFTVLRAMNMAGSANITVTKEQLLRLNEQLNKIKK